MSLVRIAVLSSLIVGGCVGEDQVEIDSVLKPPVGVDDACSDWGCGSNSPEMDSLGFHDLNVANLPNLQGFVVDGFRKQDSAGNWVKYTPYVRNAKLYARHANGTILPSVVAGVFDLHNGAKKYELRVAETSTVNYWVVTATGPISSMAYILQWRPLNNGEFKGLCKNPNSSLPEDGLSGFYAVLFEDDRINADEIRVTGQEANWFNIGCGGHALSKQHLMGETQAAGNVLGITTTLADRTANLKMLSADYCGTGDPFTVAGQPLRYRDEKNGVNTITAGNGLEARFTEKGAICLETPRVAKNPTPAGVAQFGGNVEYYIAKTCHRPPACANKSTSVMDGAHVISANP